MTRKYKKSNRPGFKQGEPPNHLGQHLLHNKKLILEIVERAEISDGETVLELGAGQGALTVALSQKAAKVLAIEYDPGFVEKLKQKTEQLANVKVVRQDILKLRLPKEAFLVVSNIPFSITTPILKQLLSQPATGLHRALLIMEKGAARRFTGTQVKDAYVLAWKMWFDFKFIKLIPRMNFAPPPSVDSALVRIDRKREPLVPYPERGVFLGLAEYALKSPYVSFDAVFSAFFTKPQLKILRRDLAIDGALTAIGALTPEQWGKVHHALVRYVPRHRWPRARK
ncbi:23S ribosomal RNA methyltransferase Erm [Paenibacillus phocaensis]|uniref:23S ribosomal RNA methyltransferase Erm n=1 Tax=Paenibacillus phocaensis TaxID=1776378 RepID=UPI000839D3BB|nr:23S ribosomal RNA methyltransferase Erm [Paenibacillus phocaensis]